jgi:nijmegen breakage syndrome protein 1
MDQLLPAAAARKKQRLNESSTNRVKTPETEKKPARKLKSERKIDLLAEVQKRREEEEARAREDAENLKAALDSMEITGPANLVTIEEITLSRSHSASASRTSAAASARWDERWNDRPNFKRFRRKGEDRPAQPRQRNFVPMEESRRRDFGIGEEYWLESSTKGKGRSQRESQKETQTQMQTQTLREEDNDENYTQLRRRPRTEKTAQVIEDDEDVQIVEESVRTAATSTQGSATRKRPANEPPAREPPAKKKATQSWKSRAVSEDEEEEDELAFPKRKTTAPRR